MGMCCRGRTTGLHNSAVSFVAVFHVKHTVGLVLPDGVELGDVGAAFDAVLVAHEEVDINPEYRRHLRDKAKLGNLKGHNE